MVYFPFFQLREKHHQSQLVVKNSSLLIKFFPPVRAGGTNCNQQLIVFLELIASSDVFLLAERRGNKPYKQMKYIFN